MRAHRASTWTGVVAAAIALGGVGSAIHAAAASTAARTITGPGTALLSGLSERATAAIVAVAALLVAAGLALLGRSVRAVARGAARPGWRGARAGIAGGTAAAAATVLALLCDAMPLAVTGYLPLLVIGSFFSAEVREVLTLVAQPAVLTEIGMVLAVPAAVIAVVLSLDALRGAAPVPHWLRPASAARWGRVAAVVAVVMPSLYAFTRIVWNLGWPLGIDAEAYTASGGDLRSGLLLAAGAVGGALLTTGLVRPWGERVWAWVPRVGGRSVPVWLAVIPAAVVSAMLLPAGLAELHAALTGTDMSQILGDLGTNWAAMGATFVWPIWSVALAAATLAYAARRRSVSPGTL